MKSAQEIYSSNLTLGDARELYFALNNLGRGGYEDKWVKVEYGPFRFYFPNTKSRVKAVRYHDLHHVLTEYDTSLAGECEIGAWEVATGCAGYFTAWFLNLSVFAVGLFLNPTGVYRAFLRGRRSGNLYRFPFDEELLSAKVRDVRGKLRLNEAVPPPALNDNAAFVLWSIVSAATLLTVVGLIITPLVLIFALLTKG